MRRWSGSLGLLLMLFSFSSAWGGEPPAEPLTLKVRSGDLPGTLTLLGRIARANVILENSVSGRITLNLEKVSFSAALAAVAAAAGLTVVRTEDNVYIVSKPATAGLSPLVSGIVQAGGGSDPAQRPVSFNVKNAELGSVIENIANQAGVQLVIKGILQDRVTGRMAGVPFERALGHLLGGTRSGYLHEDAIYLIADATPGTLTSRLLEQTDVVPLSYTSAKTVNTLVPASLAPYTKADPIRNAVVISGTEAIRRQVKQLLARIDAPIKQVVFEVKIVELSESGSRDLNVLKGVQNGSATGTTSDDTTTSSTNLSLASQLTGGVAVGVFNNVARILEVVSGLVTQGKGRLLTDTKLSTVSGQKASLDVQTDINLTLTAQSTINGSTSNTSTINTLRAGTVVELEPTVQADGNVLAILSLESSVAGTQTNANTAPNISRRKVRNTLLLKDGLTVEIGGLIQNNTHENVTRLPLFGYLPLIGQLFSNTSVSVEQSELLVFITPRIRDVQPIEATRLPLEPQR